MSLVISALLAVIDLTTQVLAQLATVDASDWGVAVTRAYLDQAVANEMWRHCVTRGRWTKLLTPIQRFLKMKDLLDPSDELPDGDVVPESPLWLSVVGFVRHEVVSSSPYVGPKPHINVGEVRAQLERERIAVKETPESKLLIGVDSQVSLGTFVKGRSQSPSLNAELEAGLPNILGGGLYNGNCWIPSKLNSSDDPTRGVDIRTPHLEKLVWRDDVLNGDFQKKTSACSK